ncbi:phenylalanine--tRNA ligase subunit alpha [Candidatus Karelsulcia muelleri]|uniref:phenylalanine--tRNA ligase subunit alpha n=1 Tax=Candidatus Karelsulcia muelleri TaxID=336810 RepID=UPI000D7CEEBF|nr:phenylalanine--tRNA ligase subunit alpha [Candidatus Karelsulcia muelleri]
MLNKIKKIKKDFFLLKINSLSELEILKTKYLGKKGILNFFFKEIKFIENSELEKKKIGFYLNSLKKDIEIYINKSKQIFLKKKKKIKKKDYFTDFTKPGNKKDLGSRHPISIIENRIINIFNKIGFKICEGPEIENDWYNFTALNFPSNHPAREMQDTFFLKKSNKLLRTHTSSVQIRYMEKNTPPIRVISPGRVYRNEKISSNSHYLFHQIEVFYLDKKVSFKDLKNTINFFIKNFFGKSITRFRPSYFPFTEPSAELDILWNNKWLEILGCGMIDPIVLNNININSEIYSGFAFGIGIERITLMIYNLNDIRDFFENDLRFLKQFKQEF